MHVMYYWCTLSWCMIDSIDFISINSKPYNLFVFHWRRSTILTINFFFALNHNRLTKLKSRIFFVRIANAIPTELDATDN